MEKLIFNTLSKQAKELEKTAKNTLIEFLNARKNKTYQTDKITEENRIFMYGGRSYAFVGCFIEKKEAHNTHKGLKLLGYQIDNKTTEISYKELFEIELYNIDNVQLLNVIQFINEREFLSNLD